MEQTTPFTQQLLGIILPALLTLIAAMVSIGLKYVIQWLNTKVKNDELKSAIEMLSDVTWDVVNEMEQTVRPMLSDGKLTKEEQARIKRAAIDKVNNVLAPTVKKSLEKTVGNMEKMIETKIEAYVKTMKERSGK
mgnify:CR=1 FL=1